MVKQLGALTLAFILSATDYHWNKIFTLICPNRDPRTIQKNKRRALMQANPLIKADFFKKRVESFRKEVLCPMFVVKDYWMRYE